MRCSPRSAWAVALGILVWEEGGEAVGALIGVGVVALGSLVWWLHRRKSEAKPALPDIGLFASKYFRLGISSQTLEQIALGGLMIALPIYLQMVLEYNAMEAVIAIAPLSLSILVAALLAGKKAGGRSPSGSQRGGGRQLGGGIVRTLFRPRVRQHAIMLACWRCAFTQEADSSGGPHGR